MHEYEIRVLSAGHTAIILEEVHLSDHAAVRSARKFAGERAFEVWRGLDCIYETPTTRGPGNGSPSPQP